MYSKVYSMGLCGMNSFVVEVEVDLSSGLPRFDLVGLPDSSVSESKERVRSAIKNCSLDFPVSRITVNLAPADLRKEGPIYDLPILAAILTATKQMACPEKDYAFLGEISLNGDLRRINGVLPMVIKAKSFGFKNIFIPFDNSCEASIVSGINIFAVKHISEIIGHFNENKKIKSCDPISFGRYNDFTDILDFSDVKGQYEAKRALEIAAAGSHNVMMIGTPGSGKSMLAKRLPSILPDMTFDESIETTEIYSVSGALSSIRPMVKTRPFRSPHHTVSSSGLAGGGTVPKPGEISLAHNGVLFLDELPEFSRASMETLRQPMEDGSISISRVMGTLTYPCSIMLVCAMNPCPCGYFGHPTRNCTCPKSAAFKYLSRVSGPLLDRIDIHIEVEPVDFNQLSDSTCGEPSSSIKSRVNEAREIQRSRFKDSGVKCNAQMSAAMVRKHCKISHEAGAMLKDSFERLGLSARAYDKILKLARTIADLDKSADIETDHLAEAIQYRSLDRKFWRE